MNRQQKRKLRTRNLIKDTTLALLIEHGFNNITIQQITDTADLARGTFYVHFGDKDEVVWEFVEEMMLEIEQISTTLPMETPDQHYAKWIALFAEIQKHQQLIEVILGPKGDVKLVGRFQAFLAQVMERRLVEDNTPFMVGTPRPVAARLLAGALSQLLLWWFEQAEEVSTEEIATHFFALVRPVLS